MGRQINAELDPMAEEYFGQVESTLDKKDQTPITDKDVVNYCFTALSAIETVLLSTIGDADPVEFVKGVADGSLLIVKKK
jgi:hypothetical protein